MRRCAHRLVAVGCLVTLLGSWGCGDEPKAQSVAFELRPITGFDSPLWTSEIPEDDPVVATVSGTPITLGMLQRQLEREGGDPDPREVLERMIEFELLARSAFDAGLYTPQVLAEPMKQALARALVIRRFERELGPDDIPPEYRQQAYQFMLGEYDHFEIFHVLDAQILCCDRENPEDCFMDQFDDVEGRVEHHRQCFEYHRAEAEKLRQALVGATTGDEVRKRMDVATLEIPAQALRDQFFTHADLADYEFQFDVDKTWEQQFGEEAERIRYRVFAKAVTEGAAKAWKEAGRETPVLTPVLKSQYGYHVIFVEKVEQERHWKIDHPQVAKDIDQNAFEPWRKAYFIQVVEKLCADIGCELHPERLVPLQELEGKGSAAP